MTRAHTAGAGPRQRGTKPRPITDEERDTVRRLHGEGKSRNQIARVIERSGSTVTKIAQDLGLSFERGEMIAAATEARKVDARARRAALAIALLDDAERLRQQLWEEAEYVEHGGKEFVEARWTRPRPTFGDQRAIMQAVGVAIDKAVRLDEYDSGTGVGQVVSLLEVLGAGLAAKYGTGDDKPGGEPAPAGPET